MSEDAFDEVVRQAQARVGRTLKGKWTLDQLLGVGGMASVYAATHRNQRRAALKMLHPELSFNAAVRERFLREGYVANSVQHPGAVAVFDDDVSEDGCAFLVMELLDGETLEARWERKGKRLPPGEVMAFADCVLDTLAAAHARGIVHRDLKPENLFLTRDAQVKVLDFGIARVRELGGTSKTQTGSVMGTPTFMPPEQARGRWEEVDARSDLWALGATMFTLLSGELVHVAGTVNEALVQAVTQPARSLASVVPGLPAPIVAFVDRTLAFEKQDRWPDAAAMQQALREAYAAFEADWDEQTVLADAAAALPTSTLVSPQGLAGFTALATSASAPPTSPPRHIAPLWLAAAAGAVLFLVVLMFALSRGGSTESELPQSTHAAASSAQALPAPTVRVVEQPPTIAFSPASPPPISVDALPSESPRPDAPRATRGEVAGTPSPASPPPAVASTHTAPPPAPPKPKPAATDPFAARE